MRMRLLPAVLMLGCAWAGPLRADLKAALAEPNLGKRSKLALDNAAEALKAAPKVSSCSRSSILSMGDPIRMTLTLAGA